MLQQDKPSKTEKFNYYNSLVCLVKSLENKYTVVDLRNESYVSGKIKKVDGFMNIEMEDVEFCDSRGAQYPFASFYVKARNIRYVHIPKGASSEELLKLQLAQMSRTMQRPPTGKKSFKRVRAERYNKEIVNSAFEPSTSSTTTL